MFHLQHVRGEPCKNSTHLLRRKRALPILAVIGIGFAWLSAAIPGIAAGSAAHTRIDGLRRDLNTFKSQTTQNFVTLQLKTDVLTKLTKAINNDLVGLANTTSLLISRFNSNMKQINQRATQTRTWMNAMVSSIILWQHYTDLLAHYQHINAARAAYNNEINLLRAEMTALYLAIGQGHNRLPLKIAAEVARQICKLYKTHKKQLFTACHSNYAPFIKTVFITDSKLHDNWFTLTVSVPWVHPKFHPGTAYTLKPLEIAYKHKYKVQLTLAKRYSLIFRRTNKFYAATPHTQCILTDNYFCANEPLPLSKKESLCAAALFFTPQRVKYFCEFTKSPISCSANPVVEITTGLFHFHGGCGHVLRFSLNGTIVTKQADEPVLFRPDGNSTVMLNRDDISFHVPQQTHRMSVSAQFPSLVNLFAQYSRAYLAHHKFHRHSKLSNLSDLHIASLQSFDGKVQLATKRAQQLTSLLHHYRITKSSTAFATLDTFSQCIMYVPVIVSVLSLLFSGLLFIQFK